jgi:F0F1-type ATP synthase membrane subunit b/b'
MAVFDKIRYAFSLFDSNELLIIVISVLIYHILIAAFVYAAVRTTMVVRERELKQERDEYKKNWDHRDLAWKDREEELKRILHGEKEMEISQLKAEYDSYISLLEQKLDRSRTREKATN